MRGGIRRRLDRLDGGLPCAHEEAQRELLRVLDAEALDELDEPVSSPQKSLADEGIECQVCGLTIYKVSIAVWDEFMGVGGG